MRNQRLAVGIGFAFLTLTLGSCSSAPSKGDSVYLEAVRLARSGKSIEARQAFERACQADHRAACQRVDAEAKPIESAGLARLSVAQLATDARTTHLVVLHRMDSVPEALLWGVGVGKPIEPASSSEIVIPDSPWRLRHLRYEGLSPTALYDFQLIAPTGTLLDARKLRTLDPKRGRARIAVASCLDDAFGEQKAMWTELLADHPDALFLIGDNVYADKGAIGFADPKRLWSRYVETRNALALFKSETLVPIFATWDDHDYGMKDGNGTYEHRAESEKVFFAFFGKHELGTTYVRGPGVSSRLSAFGQSFYFLDDRSFRSPKGDKEQTHFGKDQEAWLFSGLSPKSPGWIISGDQFFGGYHKYDSYEGDHPDSFRKFLGRLKREKTSVLFLSGDRHLAEIMEIDAKEIGYRTYELTTSAIHARTFPDAWKTEPNPRHMIGASGVMNYMIFDLRPPKRPTDRLIDVDVLAYGPQKKLLFQRSLRVKR